MKNIRSEHGISLLEVLIAVIILSLALLVLLNMAMIALDGNNWSNKTTIATQLMQQKLEQIRGTQDFSSGSDTVDGMVRTWSVGNAGQHLRQARVSVSWEDMKANQVTNTMTALIKSDSI